MRAKRGISRALLSLCVAVAAGLGGLGVARARDNWTSPYPGVRHLHRVRPGTDLHAIVVDLTAAELSVTATRPEDRSMTVRDFARRYDADIAINANYFDWGSKPCGLAVGDGVVYGDAYEEACSASVGFGRLNEAEAFDSMASLRGPLPERWMTEVVSGKPWLIREGVLQGGWLEPRHIEYRHPRTSVGISRDRQTLVILVVDGRRDAARGMTGDELVQTMAELGAWNALNLDGGGSTELYVRAEGGVQNHPPSGRARTVSNHLGIRVRRGAHWFAGMLEAVSPMASLAPGSRGHAWARWRNTGRAPWPAGGVELAVADEATSPLYDPEAWLSDRVPSNLTSVVWPGETATFAFTVAAPMLEGRYEARLVPSLANAGRVAADEAHVELAVEPDAAFAIAASAERLPSDALPTPAPAAVPADFVQAIAPVAVLRPDALGRRRPRVALAVVDGAPSLKASGAAPLVGLAADRRRGR